MNVNVVTKVPGKLYLVGEYGVVHGTHSLLLATKVTLSVRVQAAHRSSIHSTQWTQPILFDFATLTPSNPWMQALCTVRDYLFEQNIALNPCAIQIETDLDAASHRSLGLGSSGALVVALCEALTTFAQVPLNPLDLYKLSVLSQRQTAASTSFGDLACSSFKTTLLYRAPERSWLLKAQGTLTTLMAQTWPKLVIEPIRHEPLPLLVINTGEKTSSQALVQAVRTFFEDSKHIPWLNAVDELVLKTKTALEQGDLNVLYTQLNAQRVLHETLAHQTQAPLFIEAYATLDRLFKDKAHASKFSGAGGGDNYLIAIDPQPLAPLHALLESTPYVLIQDAIQGVLHDKS